MADTSLRTLIGDALVETISNINQKLKQDDNVTPIYNSNVKHCQRRLLFIDEIEDNDDFPCVFLTAASESREYNPSQGHVRHILFIVRGYTYDETDSDAALNNLAEDIELAIERKFFANGFNGLLNDIRVAEITSDEGLLSPSAVFEMILDATIIKCGV